MGKTAVIFKSKCGHTKKYAEWISADLNGDLIEVSKVKIEKILEYDTIVFGGSNGLMRISSNGGVPKSIVKTKGIFSQCPQILPGGKAVLYEVHSGTHKVMVQSFGSGEAKELFEGSGARYLRTGHIMCAEHVRQLGSESLPPT